ncbi:hypothetical protein DERF_005161 [Dermatophagoides farinae]|uniref:Uncharacterized protein n=1 Tax=Dermatophagoides farinae TaxID=6954 RepID=A0A922L0M5_DERFA|nr:hypothetical protein DERF_015759 [Dermatophagoides farinae]KAH9521509.1 hypothetical protein DERF_005161 [Dermatophagoides farinae]
MKTYGKWCPFVSTVYTGHKNALSHCRWTVHCQHKIVQFISISIKNITLLNIFVKKILKKT